jgi:hypothetical protein
MRENVYHIKKMCIHIKIRKLVLRHLQELKVTEEFCFQRQAGNTVGIVNTMHKRINVRVSVKQISKAANSHDRCDLLLTESKLKAEDGNS